MTGTAQAPRDSSASLTSEHCGLSGRAGRRRLPISTAREQGAALSVRGSDQVLSPSAHGIRAAGTDSPELGRLRNSTSQPAATSSQDQRGPVPHGSQGPGSPEDMWPVGQQQKATASVVPLDKGFRRELWPKVEPETWFVGARPVLQGTCRKTRRRFCHRHRQLHIKNTEEKPRSDGRFCIMKELLEDLPRVKHLKGFRLRLDWWSLRRQVFHV